MSFARSAAVVAALCFVCASVTAAEPALLSELVAKAVAGGEKTLTLTEREYRADATIKLEKLEGFTLDGQGARLVLTKPVTAVRLNYCAGVTIKNLVIDYDPLPFTQGVVTALTPDGKSFDYALDDGYPRLTKEYAVGRAHLFTPDGRFWKRDAADLYGANAVVDDAHGRFTPSKPEPALAVGDRVAFNLRQNHAFYLHGSGGTRFENVTLHAAPSLGFCSRFGPGGDELVKVRIERGPTPPGATAGRLLSTCADGLNYAYIRKGPKLVDCDFSFMGDDSVNLHAVALPVAAVVDPVTFDGLRPHRGEGFHEVVRPGDEVRFLNPKDYRILCTATVKSFRRSPRAYTEETAKRFFTHRSPGAAQGFEVTLEKAPDFAIVPGMFFDIPAIGAPDYEIRDSRFHDHRARGLRLMASRGVVANNDFERIKQAAVTVGAEYGFWREAGWVSDVVVTGNRVKEVGHGMLARPETYACGALSVFARLEDYSGTFKGNRYLVLSDNTVEDCPGAGIFVYAANGVQITGNRLKATATAKNTPGSEYGFKGLAPIWTLNAANLVVEGNKIE